MTHYYRKVLLTQKLLPALREISGEFFSFQQGNAPAHLARGTINLLKRDTCVYFTRFLPSNSTDLKLIGCKNIGEMQQRSSKFMTSMNTEAALDRCLASFLAKYH